MHTAVRGGGGSGSSGAGLRCGGGHGRGAAALSRRSCGRLGDRYTLRHVFSGSWSGAGASSPGAVAKSSRTGGRFYAFQVYKEHPAAASGSFNGVSIIDFEVRKGAAVAALLGCVNIRGAIFN